MVSGFALLRSATFVRAWCPVIINMTAMLRAILPFLATATCALVSVASAQQLYWKEIPNPGVPILSRGVQVLDGQLFVKSSATDGSLKLLSSTDQGKTWSISTLPEPLTALDKIVRLSDTSLAVVGHVSPTESYLFRSDRTGTTWQRYPGLDVVHYVLKDLPPHDDGPSIIEGTGLRDIWDDSVSSTYRAYFSLIDTWFDNWMRNAEDQIVYHVGRRQFEDPMRPPELVHGLVNDQGKESEFYGRPGDPFSDHQLAANGSIGVFFTSSAAVGIGYGNDGPDQTSLRWDAVVNGLIADVAIANNSKTFIASTNGVFAAVPSRSLEWRELGNISGSPNAIATMDDTLLIAAADGRLFITSVDVTSAVSISNETSEPSVIFSPRTRVLSVTGFTGDYSLDVVKAVSGIATPIATRRNENTITLPREVVNGVYLYRLILDGGTTTGKLLIY